MAKIQDCAAFVTGANRGVGAAFVDALIDRGAAKIYAAARDPETLSGAVQRFGGRIEPLRLELTDPETLAEAAKRCADVDLLINNAARGCLGPMLDPTADADLHDTMETNYFGPLRLTRAFADTLAARKGGVIIVLSMTGILPSADAGGYSASKFAMSAAGHCLRQEFAVRGVGVSMVYPGFIDTDMSDGFDVPKASPRQIAERTLDGWLKGDAAIFPDVFAEMTRDVVVSRPDDVLQNPCGLVHELVAQFVQRPDAGQ